MRSIANIFRPCKLVIAILCLSLFVPAFSQAPLNLPISGSPATPGVQALDKNLVNFMRRWNMPGASLAVMKDGKVVALRAYGWADIGKRIPMQTNNIFRIASASKTFTAATVLRLAQEGKLSLDDKVFSILSDLKPLNDKSVDPRVYQMTVKNLLQMSSGWFRPGSGHFDPLFGPWPKYFEDALSPELPASCQTTTRVMLSVPLKYKPGTTYVYSNLDYCILGLIINKVTGASYGYLGYQNFVRQHMLAPLRITDMGIGSTQIKYRFPKEVTYYRDGHTISADELNRSFYLPYSTDEILRKDFANGGWVASAIDLAIFLQALRNGYILNSDYLGIMQSKPAFVPKNKSTYYTMGGIIDNVGKGSFNWIQTGSFTATNAFILTKPDGTTYAIIFNSKPGYGLFNKFRPELKRIFLNANL
ncbi:MAG: serine hydrolase domain-containing protein [Gammaproteobacteria bacterium]